jgi:hypothetical protein
MVAKLKYIDLFAGCGGLSTGLHLAAWQGLFAIERNASAFSTLKANLIDKKKHFDWPTWLPAKNWDIKDLLAQKNQALAQLKGTVDLIVGGPPCQGFSTAGRRHESDERNNLVHSYLSMVELVHPIACAAHYMGNLVSLQRSGPPSQKKLAVLFCRQGHSVKEIDNLVDARDLPAFRWKYVPSPKHARGGFGTFMDLDDETAQDVLERGIEVGRRVFGFHQEKYYIFNPDNFLGYHGYPIEIREVPPVAIAQLRAMQMGN